MSKFSEWCKSHRGLLESLAAAISAIIIAVLCASCSVVKATTSNRAGGTTTEVKITTSNPQNITVSPDVDVNTNSKPLE